MGYFTIGGSKRRVFVSFDVERDRPFRDFFYRQGRKDDATWHVSFASELYDQTDPMWISTATGRIKQFEALVVLLTSTAYRSPGVLKEVAIAHILNKNVIQIIPYGAGSPHTIPNAGRVVRWEWDAVKRAIAAPPAFGSRRYVIAH